MTRHLVAGLLTLAALVSAAMVLLTASRSEAMSGQPSIDWRYNPTTGAVSWNTRDFAPGEWAYFNIGYDDGHPTFWSAMTLDSTGYAEPDPVSVAGCGWQTWVVYRGAGSQLDNANYLRQLTLTPPASRLLAGGRVYACGNAA